jgi:hypothetical protein
MPPADRYDDWVKRYVSAWSTNDPTEIGNLFTEDARYLTTPHSDPWIGRSTIVAGWIDRKDEPGAWTFDYEILIADDDLGILKGRTIYESDGEDYYNLWEMRLDDDGRCREFIEWWVVRPIAS